MRVDLHIHSTASDGAWRPQQVVEAAAAGRLDVIALSDHDTMAGVPAALAAAAASGLRVVPALELSTSRRGRELHVLAYFVDGEAPALRSHQERAVGGRVRRMETMIARLGEAGVHVEMDAVVAVAGPHAGVLGRPHLARALVQAGHATSVPDAFDRYLADGLPAFEPTALLDPVEAVELAREAGGMAVWAHPPLEAMDALLPELVRAGLAGIEVYRPLSTADHVRRLEGVARTAGLFTTGGSDWHAPDRDPPLGTFAAPWEHVAAFLEAGGV